MWKIPLNLLIIMPVIVFSFDQKLNHDPKMPDILLDGSVMDVNNSIHRKALDVALENRDNVLISSSTDYNATDFARAFGKDIDQIRAKKVDLHDLQKALQVARGVSQDPAEYFYQRDLNSAQHRKAFAEEMHKRLNRYNSSQDARLDDRRQNIITKTKLELKNNADVMSQKASCASEILDGMPNCHATKVNHAFNRMRHIASEQSFNQHISMINLNNESQFGRDLFEVDYKQAQDVLNTLYTKVDENVTYISDRYLGMKDGEIDPSRENEFTKLALNHFPDLLNFGIQTDSDTAFKQISAADRLAELFKTKMPDGTNLVNPTWFKQLDQAGIRYDIGEVHKNKSIAAKHLMNNQKPVGMQPKDAMRYDFVVDMLKARQSYIDFHKNNLDIEKIMNVAEANDNKVPMVSTYAGAISKRFTSGGNSGLNNLGMQTASKSVLKAPKDGVIIDIDYSQAELAMAAAVLNNQAILQAYNERSDIYLALGLQAEHVVKGQPLPWEQLIAETKNLQANTPEDVKADKNSHYHRMRSGGKMVVIPAIYGSGSDKLAKEQGITVSQAQTLMRAFDHVFPEVAQTRDALGEYMRQHVGNPDAPDFQFGGHDGKLVTINANDKRFTESYTYADPAKEVLAGTQAQHSWLMGEIGLLNTGPQQESALTVTLSNGEKMVYNNPHVAQGDRGLGIYYINDNGDSSPLPKHTLLQNIVQFATFAAVREMTVNATKAMDEMGIDTKYLLNIHDSNAFLAKNEMEAEKTLQLMNTGVLSKSELVPQLNFAYTIDKGPRLAEMKNIIEYQSEVRLDMLELDNNDKPKQEYDNSAINAFEANAGLELEAFMMGMQGTPILENRSPVQPPTHKPETQHHTPINSI